MSTNLIMFYPVTDGQEESYESYTSYNVDYSYRVAGERGCVMIKNDHKHKILINDLWQHTQITTPKLYLNFSYFLFINEIIPNY